MTLTEQHFIIFWVFIVFFVLIGIISLLVIVGIVKTDSTFRRWALSGFCASVVGVVFIWAKMPPPVDFEVQISPPEGIAATNFDLSEGTWQYKDFDAIKPKLHEGPIALTAGQEPGSSLAKLPYEVIGNPIRLFLTDTRGGKWMTEAFYINKTQKNLKKSEDSGQSSEEPSDRGAARTAHRFFAEAGALSLKPAPLTASFTLINSAFAQETQRFNHCALPVSRQADKTYYRWRIFVNDTPEEISNIREVDYLLPSSFSDPLVELGEANASNKFVLERVGKDDFDIKINVTYKSGNTINIAYRVVLTTICDNDRNLLRNLKILWVDDHPDNNVSERTALMESGITFELAQNTSDAESRMQTGHFNLIISDFKRGNDPQAPYALLDFVRNSQSPLPYIFYSSSATDANIQDAIQHGAFGETNLPDKLLDLIIKAIKSNP